MAEKTFRLDRNETISLDGCEPQESSSMTKTPMRTHSSSSASDESTIPLNDSRPVNSSTNTVKFNYEDNKQDIIVDRKGSKSVPMPAQKMKKAFRTIKHTMKFAEPTESGKVLQKRLAVKEEPKFLPLDPLWLSCRSELLYTDDGVAQGVAKWTPINGSGIVRLRTTTRLKDMRLAGNIHDGLPGEKKIPKKEPERFDLRYRNVDLNVGDRFPCIGLPQARVQKAPEIARTWEDPEVWATRAQQGASRLSFENFTAGGGVPGQPKPGLQRSQSAMIVRRSKDHNEQENQQLKQSHRDFMRLLGRPGEQPGRFAGSPLLFRGFADPNN